MRYWLFKSEPDAFSWDDLVAAGPAGEEWDGVRNYQARNVMREMRVGDRGFLYHSGTDRAVVGIVEVSAESHPDGTTDDPRWDCVDIRALDPLPRPVTLTEIRGAPALAGMPLVRQARLSVQPVPQEAWAAILRMGGAGAGWGTD